MNRFLILIFILIANLSIAQQKRSYTTTRISQEPNIDGVIEESAWGSDNWEGDFTQREPHDGAAPSQPTFFKVLYSNDFIYVAIKAIDNSADSIDSRLVRSDNIDGDVVAVHFDSYYDKRTSFSFFLSAAGVKTDILFSNNGNNEDENWNPIWYAKTSIDSNGWYAEMKIPLSQLRFSKTENKVWGFEVLRHLYRLDETSLWQPISRKESGWVYNFGELRGIADLKPKRIIEIAPYATAGIETYKAEDGPYNDGVDFLYGLGVDGKIGITNDFVLDFTINPDFGQVEADPSEVNLSAFETYQREQRPFFIAGKNITDFNISGGEGGESARDNLFYSRRIGRSPQYYPSADYVDFPRNTKIIAALKLSGKTKNGLSVGIIESVTREEVAATTTNDKEEFMAVEPLTNYFVARVQKDINQGNTVVGGVITSVNRKIEDETLNFLPKSAVSAGLDFEQYWKNRTYFLRVSAVGSFISGDTSAMLDRQYASQRYYQRPDANYVSIDSASTNMSGYGGDIAIGKQTESGWSYNLRFSTRSPGLSINDIGFIKQADRIMSVGTIGYNFTEPTRLYRNISTGISVWNGWDYGGKTIFSGFFLWHRTRFSNYYSLSLNSMTEVNRHDNYHLRGGPAFYLPGTSSFRANLESNTTKRFYLDVGTSQNWGYNGSSRRKAVDMGFTYRPTDALELAFHPNFSYSRNELQYVDQFYANGNTDYVLANIEQKTLFLRFMVDYSISPSLTIQYYGAPFISSGNYSDFKSVDNPNAANYNDRFHSFTDKEIFYDESTEVYTVDANGDGTVDYGFGNPNFNFKEFQSNLVLRWEFTPGSMLFFVWSQNRMHGDGFGTFTFSDNMERLFTTYPHDIIMVKLSYRFF